MKKVHQGCTRTQCGASFIDTLLVTRIGLSQAGAAELRAEAKGVEITKLIRDAIYEKYGVK
jgi:hypothetical protein